MLILRSARLGHIRVSPPDGLSSWDRTRLSRGWLEGVRRAHQQQHQNNDSTPPPCPLPPPCNRTAAADIIVTPCGSGAISSEPGGLVLPIPRSFPGQLALLEQPPLCGDRHIYTGSGCQHGGTARREFDGRGI